MEKFTIRKLIFQHLIVFVILVITLLTASAQRETKTINNGWQFHQGDARYANDTLISIPHTWNIDAYVHKAYSKGKAWYRRDLLLPQAWSGKQLFLTFEGASKSAQLYVNDQLVGEHRGGYTAFTYDITNFYSFNSPNIISVCVDNSNEDIPPISGDFTFFGGIYRDVWITAVPKQHFNFTNHGSSGIFIETPHVSENEASLNVRAEIKNDSPTKTTIIVENILYTPDEQVVQKLKRSIQLAAGQLFINVETFKPIMHPLLWSPETPHLYRVETTLRNAKTNEIIDQISHYTGFRWYRFDGDKGFFLNGKPYKLRGICRHQDQKPIGVALSDEMHRRDMLLVKEMGANFIRISHYPQDAAILEMCDKLGLLAWEEIPVIDIVPESDAYAETCELNLREMIRQHYNHPSIIMWGYMNEILLVTQRRYHGDELKPVVERTLALANRLEKVVKEEDSLRSSVMAFHGSNSYNELGFGEITDIVGWNLYSGWYGGQLSGFENFLDEQHRKYPTHPIIVSEYGAGSDRRLHSQNPKAFDFSIEYQQKYLEHYLPVIEEKEFISGASHWNFIDFSSASRDESMPRINNKGLVYSDRTPKDIYFYFKALWRNDIPVIHVASHDWTQRSGIQIANQPIIQPVKVYSNLPEVELFLNGISLGRQRVVNCTATFEVPLIGGHHFIRATGTYQLNSVEDGVRIHFTAIPSTLNQNNLSGLELAINVGSQCFFTSDESNLTWVPDRPYELGGWGYLGNDSTKEESTQAQINLTADNPLYQTLRSDLDGYRFDVPPGNYEVELLFADIFKVNENAAYLLGRESQIATQQNAFQILINNQVVEDSFCPSNEVGKLTAIKKRYVIHVDYENLIIQFKTLHNQCFLNGIKLRKL